MEKVLDNLENERLKVLKKFLKIDLEIKNELVNLAPNPADDFDESTRIEYVDKIYRSIKDFEYQFQSSLEGFEMGKDVKKTIQIFFRKLRDNLAVGSYDKGTCQIIFQEFFSNMSKSLIENVKKSFVGYTGYGEQKLSQLIEEASTINELLHICHSYIMNNEKILGSITKLDEKENKFGYPIILYGEKSDISKELFEKFPIDLDVGFTDIVSVQDQILMMVRDRGHALTLDIDTSHDKPFVRYFIPKICNEEMVMALPGVDKKNLSVNGVSGRFECDKQEFLERIFGFIGKVPMDEDIPSIEYTQGESVDTDSINQDIETQTETEAFFSVGDVKELTTKEGKNGIKFRNIKVLQYKVANFFRKLQSKTNDRKEGKNER